MNGTVFTIPGPPVQQGSMRAFTRPGGRVGMTHGNEKKLREFRARIAVAADAAGVEPVRGPVKVTVAFFLPRPKGHFGTGRNAGALKDSSPRWPAGKPDVDKLERALLDGLTGIAFHDDAQVCVVNKRKSYAMPEDGYKPKTVVSIVDLAKEEQHGNSKSAPLAGRLI